MRFIFFTFGLCTASAVTRTLSISDTMPDKLRLYQNVTGIADEKLFDIFKKSKEGKVINGLKKIQNNFESIFKVDMKTRFRSFGTRGLFLVARSIRSYGRMKTSMLMLWLMVAFFCA